MILVTGANGFVGSYVVCALLQQGKNVRAQKRSTGTLSEFEFISRIHDLTPDQRNLLEWVDADITNPADLEVLFEGITEVIHCAALVSFYSSDRDKLYRTNVEGTANMVNMALDTGVKKFVYLSSVAALGRSEHSRHIDEQSKWERNPSNTHYAESKYA